MDVPAKEFRAKRPIIEFDHDIELYNHGTKFIGEVLVVEPNLKKKKKQIEVLVSILVDGPLLLVVQLYSQRIVQPKYIYKVEHANAVINLTRVANLNENPNRRW